MTTRMEKVAEDVALAALRKTAHTAGTPLDMAVLKKAFLERWPVPDSNRPMSDAVGATALVVGSCIDQNPESWGTAVAQAWQPAVQETVEEYFNTARLNFQKGEALEGLEILTDAVRATLGHIAMARNWPHSTDDDLYRITAALGSGTGWPGTTEELDRALENASKDGQEMSAAMGASMGRPRMLKFGAYEEDPDGAEEDGFLFAKTTVELVNRLAGQEPATA